MKKILCFALTTLLLLPATLLVGCKNDNSSAKEVRNKSYYISSLTRNTENLTDTATSNNARIFFGEDNFIFEIAENGSAQYGYYQGTYSVEGTKITLTITTFGGSLTNAKTTPALQFWVFDELKYKNGTLEDEFVLQNYIYQVKFTAPKKK